MRPSRPLARVFIMVARKLKFFLNCVVFVVAIAQLSGCSHSSQTNAPRPAGQSYFTHTVQYSGETLANISKWYTGQPSNWTIIQDANPSLNPRKLRIGSTVQIPQSLIVRSDAFPKPKTIQVVKHDAPALDQGSDNKASSQTTEFGYPGSVADGSHATEVVVDKSGTLAGPEENLPKSPDLVVAENPELTDRASTGEFPGTSVPDIALGDTATVTVPPPENKTGIVSGLLEAVGNAAINAKRQESATTSK